MVVDNKLVLKVEDELLLRCARSKLEEEDEDSISSLLDNNLDWDYLLNKAARNGLRPLLYLNLNRVGPEKVPEDVLQGLKSFFKNNVQKNLLFTSELLKVMDLMQENDIKAFTYKGPVLAQWAYGNIAYREFGDIDIFIDKSDATRAKEIMHANGYFLDPPIEVDDATYMKLDTEYRFRSISGGVIELNWDFAGPFYYFPHDPQILFNELIERDLNNFKIKTPNPENEFLMLAIHCAKHNWQRLSWICDIREVLENKKLDWSKIWDTAKILGVKRIVLVTLFILEDLFEFKISQPKKEDHYGQNLAQDIIDRNYLENRDSWNLVEKFFLDLRKRDNYIYGIKDCIRGFSKTTYIDYQDMRLQGHLFRLYIFIRPFLLLKRYGKGKV
ncbi:hypothetical protein JCM15415_20920 [Methanobacterium movens]